MDASSKSINKYVFQRYSKPVVIKQEVWRKEKNKKPYPHHFYLFVEVRKTYQVGLNKGEARNALAWAVFFRRLGEIRDRSFEQ